MEKNKKSKSLLTIKLKYLLALHGVTNTKEIAILLHMSLSSCYAKLREPGKLTLDDLERISETVEKPVWEILKPDAEP